jgi:peptide methionine sulfoxide reductase msrA/msrB
LIPHRVIITLIVLGAAFMAALLLTPQPLPAETKEPSAMTFRKLTPEEERVIVHKGTERPFTGKYDKFQEAGTYHCKRCDAALYTSESKFDSGCGWPAFDDEIDGAVKRLPDPDGRRTEIVCAACDGHLGHVFIGEGFTDTNTRHCVNSISMVFKPKADDAAAVTTERAIFAGGCFWGVEHYLKAVPGVIETAVGYAGGHKANPTYKEVCYTDTGHAEAVEVVFDPAKVSYETLAKLFFEIHDPTQVNRQGPDVGPQYRSAVYCVNDEQRAVVRKLIGQLEAKGLKVATEVVMDDVFYSEQMDYHHDYYDKTGKEPYCHFRVKRFD